MHISKPFFRFSDLPGLSSFLNVPYLFVNISILGLFFRWFSLCCSPQLPFHYSWSPSAYSQAFQIIVDILQRLLQFCPWGKVWIAQHIITFLRKKVCTKTHLMSRNRWKHLLHSSCRRISLVQNRPNLKPACGGVYTERLTVFQPTDQGNLQQPCMRSGDSWTALARLRISNAKINQVPPWLPGRKKAQKEGLCHPVSYTWSLTM